MTNHGRRAAGTPLTDEERRQLRELAKMPDDQIDFSDIPELTQEQLQNARPRRLRQHERAPALDKAS